MVDLVRWGASFNELVEFKKAHGHCLVETNPAGSTLASWVQHQRALHRKGRLSQDLVKQLGDLGFVWDTKAAQWDAQFERLAAFFKACGHSNVPVRWEQDPDLGAWVSRQRREYKNGALSAERAAKLAQLNFVWDGNSINAWTSMCAQLVLFWRRWGHCSGLTDPLSPRPDLGKWITQQRKAYWGGELTEEQVAMLDAIGLDWGPDTVRPDEMTARLLAFRAEHGHFDVPYPYPPDKDLGRWMQRQRRLIAKFNIEAISLMEEVAERYASSRERMRA